MCPPPQIEFRKTVIFLDTRRRTRVPPRKRAIITYVRRRRNTRTVRARAPSSDVTVRTCQPGVLLLTSARRGANKGRRASGKAVNANQANNDRVGRSPVRDPTPPPAAAGAISECPEKNTRAGKWRVPPIPIDVFCGYMSSRFRL